mgnify:CR=1 FL=1
MGDIGEGKVQDETFWNNPNDDSKVVDRERINNRFMAKGKFGLSDLKRYLYKDVCVMSKTEFQHEFVNRVKANEFSQVR